jgi:hypothetical protein
MPFALFVIPLALLAMPLALLVIPAKAGIQNYLKKENMCNC